jgi:hypothetical protein
MSSSSVLDIRVSPRRFHSILIQMISAIDMDNVFILLMFCLSDEVLMVNVDLK